MVDDFQPGGENKSRQRGGTSNLLDNFDIIPAISVQRGHIVRAKDNRYIPFSFRKVRPDTLDLIDILYETFEVILILDLDGIYRNKPAVDLYKNISQLGDFWIDGGVRYCDAVIDILVTGAQKVVISTKTLADLNELKEAYELTENIVFGLDYNNGILSPNESLRTRSPIEVLKEVGGFGIETCLFADLARVDANKTLENNLIRQMVDTGINLYVGGGVKSRELRELSKLKISGAVVELQSVLKNPEVFSIDTALLDEIAPAVDKIPDNIEK
jgi:uncharacterized protein related to proFAR isomerase